MSNYTGVRCPACAKKFAASDDIVVCPVCGAPHHRACYQDTGDCVFAAEHLSGKEWQAPQETPADGDHAGGDHAQDPSRQPATKRCGECGASNPAESIYCQICGNRLNAAARAQEDKQRGDAMFQSWVFPNYEMHFDPQTFVYGGMRPDETIDGLPVADLAVYVGPNASYYLPRFKMFSDGAPSISLNFSSFIFSYFYFFYRRLYAIGAVMLAVSIAAMIPYLLYVREMMPELVLDASFAPFMNMVRQWNLQLNLPPVEEINRSLAASYERLYLILRVVNFGLRLAMASLANMFYYRKTIKGVAEIRARFGEGFDKTRYHAALAYSGGVSQIAAAGAVVLTIAAYYAAYWIAFSGML